MDILIQWLQINGISLLLPILSGFLAWFFSRKREASEIQRTSAEGKRLLAEASNIAVEASDRAVSQWMKLYETMNQKYDSLFAELHRLEDELNLYKTENIKLKMTLEFLTEAMDKYDPEISAKAKQMLEKG